MSKFIDLKTIMFLAALWLVNLHTYAQDNEDNSIRSTRWYLTPQLTLNTPSYGSDYGILESPGIGLGLGYVLLHPESNLYLELNANRSNISFSKTDVGSLNFRNGFTDIGINIKFEPFVSFFGGQLFSPKRRKPKFRGYLTRQNITPLFLVGLGILKHSPEVNVAGVWTPLNELNATLEPVKKNAIYGKFGFGINNKVSQRLDLFLHINHSVNDLRTLFVSHDPNNPDYFIGDTERRNNFWQVGLGLKLWIAKGLKWHRKKSGVYESTTSNYQLKKFDFKINNGLTVYPWNSQVSLELEMDPNDPGNYGDIPLQIQYTYGTESNRNSTRSVRRLFPYRKDQSTKVTIPFTLTLGDYANHLINPSIRISIVGNKRRNGNPQDIAIDLSPLSLFFSDLSDPNIGKYLNNGSMNSLIEYTNNDNTQVDLALAYILNNDTKQSLSILNSTLKINPLDAMANYLKSYLLATMGKWEESSSGLKKSIALMSSDQLFPGAAEVFKFQNAPPGYASLSEQFLSTTDEVVRQKAEIDGLTALVPELKHSHITTEKKQLFFQLAFTKTGDPTFKLQEAKLMDEVGKQEEALSILSDLKNSKKDKGRAKVYLDADDLTAKILRKREILKEEDNKTKEIRKEIGPLYAMFIIQEKYTWKVNSPYGPLNHLYTDKVLEIRDLLQGRYGLEEENTRTILDASKKEILNTFKEFRNDSISKDSRLLIFYSGHGDSYAHKNEPERGYWCPIDIQQDSETGTVTNELENEELSAIVRNLRMKHVLVVGDACYGGLLGLGDKGRGESAINTLTAKEYSRWAISSGKGAVTTKGFEFLDLFYQYLAINNKDQVTNAWDLFTWLQKEMKDRGKLPGFNEINRAYPDSVSRLNRRGEFLLIKSN